MSSSGRSLERQASRGCTSRSRTRIATGTPATSEGIFIFEPNGGATYAVGDTVRVKGQVVEFNIGGSQTLTELSNLNNLDVCSSGNAVTPTPIEMPVRFRHLPGALRGHARRVSGGPRHGRHRDVQLRPIR